MNLNYSQSSGAITKDDGTLVTHGWAGHGNGKNNPTMQDQHELGPLPRGVYAVGKWEARHGNLGPIVASLTQTSGNTFGRSAFYIHGPDTNPKEYGQESKGCIVIPRPGRLAVKALLVGPSDTITVTV